MCSIRFYSSAYTFVFWIWLLRAGVSECWASQRFPSTVVPCNAWHSGDKILFQFQTSVNKLRSNPVRNETQSREGILGLHKTKVLTWTLLWTSNWRRRKQVRFVRSGYFHIRSNVRLRWSTKDTPTLSQEIVKLFFPLQRSIPPRTRPPAIPSRRRRKWWMCLLFFLHDVSFCYPLFLCWRSFSFFCCQMTLKVLLHWNGVSFTLLNFPTFLNVSVHENDVFDGALNGPRVLLQFERTIFAVLPLYVGFPFTSFFSQWAT